MRERGAGGGLRIVAVAADHLLGARAVVRDEHDHRVVVGIHLLELAKDAADLLVHAVDHGGVDGHLGALEALLLGGEGLPGNGARDFAGADARGQVLGGEVPVGPDVGVELGERTVHQPHLAHAGVALGPGFVPAFGETVLILVDVLLQGVQGEVRRGEGQVQIEGILGMILGVAFEELNGVLPDGRGGIEAVAQLAARQGFAMVIDDCLRLTVKLLPECSIT